MLAASLFILLGALQATDSIPGWRFDNGSGTYAVALDSAVHHAGTRGVRIETLSSTPIGVGNLIQSIQAGQFAGKRVRLSAWVRTRDLMGGVQLWLRADARSIMRLDNMADRALGESQEWRRIESVMDVPADAFALAFGVFVRGPGTVWLDHFSLEVVSSDVPTTKLAGESPIPEALLNERIARSQTLPSTPVNFDFEQPQRRDAQ
jgi:hypothetical protein